MAELEDDELAAELADFAPPEKPAGRPPVEERVIVGFEEIQRFAARHGRAPRNDAAGDIFERLYAVRLERLRALEEWRPVLLPLDRQGLLTGAPVASAADAAEDDTLLAELDGAESALGITSLRHVRSSVEKREAEDIASREACRDFESFKPLFLRVQRDLDSGQRVARPFVRDSGFLKADIQAGQFFILGGQTAYVAAVGTPIKAPNGEMDARLRVIYSNGTESNLLLRSLQRALYKDEAGRRISEPSAGPLFDGDADDDDHASGTIYVLRSKSDHPVVAENRAILHKIGVTGSNVERRIANARLDPTYLMADVEIMATYELYNINRAKLESLIHKIFDSAQLDVEIKDRFGQPIIPQEWFLVPLSAVDEAVQRIKDGTITGYVYDPQAARLIQLNI
jgi:hypothetical protein